MIWAGHPPRSLDGDPNCYSRLKRCHQTERAALFIELIKRVDAQEQTP